MTQTLGVAELGPEHVKKAAEMLAIDGTRIISTSEIFSPLLKMTVASQMRKGSS